MSTEEWRDIKGYEGLYQVSIDGRVRRIKMSQGSGFMTPMAQAPNHYGYPRLSLSKNNQVRQHLVHRLVAEAFLGPCPTGKEVNHKDGNKLNPHASNLEYVTSKENHCHARETGITPLGSARVGAKLTDENIPRIRALLGQGELQKVLAARYGVSRRTIGDIASRRTWRHIP